MVTGMDFDNGIFGKRPSDFPDAKSFMDWLYRMASQKVWGQDGSFTAAIINYPRHPRHLFTSTRATSAVFILLAITEIEEKLYQSCVAHNKQIEKIASDLSNIIQQYLMDDSTTSMEVRNQLANEADYPLITTVYLNEIFPQHVAGLN